MLNDLNVYYAATGIAKGRHHHGLFSDQMESYGDGKEVSQLVTDLLLEVEKIDQNKIILSSERFLELIMLDPSVFECFVKKLEKHFNVIIVSILRDYPAIVDSGVRHFINTINLENIDYYSNYFGFKINKINKYFNLDEVRKSFYLWIEKAYDNINSINFTKISIPYSRSVIPRILSEISGSRLNDLNIYLKGSDIRMNKNYFNHSMLREYENFCRNLYLSEKEAEFITYNSFYKSFK